MDLQELSSLQDEGTGVEAYFFEQLVDGSTYVARLRPSTGVSNRVKVLENTNRSRINAAVEDEFRRGLVKVVAEEEGVRPEDVELVS